MTTAEMITAIEREIGERGWAVIADGLTPALRKLFRAGAIETLQEATIEAKPDFSLYDEEAAKYASERAGEMIKDFAATTPGMLRATIEDAIREGWSGARLRDELVEHYAFGDARAMTIARTEVARAREHGSLEAAKRSGMDQKVWSLSDAGCPICQMNAAAGWIGIGEAFPSGDMAAPAHPNCTCRTAHRISGAL